MQIYDKKLLEEKSKYSQLLNSVPLPLVLINEQRFILFANNFAKNLFPSNFESSYLHQYFRDPILKNTIETVKNDLECCTEVVDNGGTILCDDYNLSYAPGVKKAIDEYNMKKNYKCEILLNSRFARIEKK